MKVKELKPLFTSEAIEARVCELAAHIDALYGEEPLVVVCVLKGGFMFFSDLVRHLRNPHVELDFVRLSSYGMGAQSSRDVVLSKDVELPLADRHVLVVEDIVDTGHSMRFLLQQLGQRGVRSLRLAVLVDKHERRETEVTADFVGFSLPEGFIVGYGLDYAEQYRHLPGVYEVIGE